MKLRKLGKSGLQVTPIAFGAWAIGGWMWGGAEENEAIKASSGVNNQVQKKCKITFGK